MAADNPWANDNPFANNVRGVPSLGAQLPSALQRCGAPARCSRLQQPRTPAQGFGGRPRRLRFAGVCAGGPPDARLRRRRPAAAVRLPQVLCWQALAGKPQPR